MTNIKTINKEYEYTLIEKKSKFISYLFPCENKENADKILEKLHKMHNDATHICYAYIINDTNIFYKSSDDGEPGGTAGAPILNVIKKNDLSNVILCVVRYFGGIKLGAGGLTRAYTNCASGVLNNIEIVNIVDAYSFDISFKYDIIKDIDKIIEKSDLEIINKKYDIVVTYTLLSYDENKKDILENKIGYLGIKFDNFKIIKTRKII